MAEPPVRAAPPWLVVDALFGAAEAIADPALRMNILRDIGICLDFGPELPHPNPQRRLIALLAVTPGLAEQCARGDDPILILHQHEKNARLDRRQLDARLAECHDTLSEV